MRSRSTKAALIVAVMLGIVLGLGIYTFDYGEGLSYFSSDPKACVNCHIMQPEYDSWQKSGHHTSARCVDCHLPPELVPKYIAKADNGYRHSKGFTFNDFHEPIQITPRNSEILQDNCLRCHGEFVHNILPSNQTIDTSTVQCVHCHARVGHGPLR